MLNGMMKSLFPGSLPEKPFIPASNTSCFIPKNAPIPRQLPRDAITGQWEIQNYMYFKNLTPLLLEQQRGELHGRSGKNLPAMKLKFAGNMTSLTVPA
ncbi:hypothetical protein [Novosphingobium sp. ST904]|uniref:hypothetical protein n=1 Tax=Novosphingobium sp. ST904 TaxID=1684385 RepID=UPI000AC29F72|nr:hypothetical protein [Novosphingobium sp. ST904]